MVFDPLGDTATVYIGGKPCQEAGNAGTCGLEHVLVSVRLQNDPANEVVLEMGDELRWRYRDPGGLEFAWATLDWSTFPAVVPGVLELRIFDPDGDYTNNAGTIVEGYVIIVVM